MSTIKVEEIQHPSNSNNAVSIASDSSVSLKHSGSAKLATTSTGVSITGTCAATAYTGDGSALTGISSGITVQDEGSALSTAATTLDFVGAGVTASGTGASKTITIPGGGGGTEFVSKTTLSSNATNVDFTGLDADSVYLLIGKIVNFFTSDGVTPQNSFPYVYLFDASGSVMANKINFRRDLASTLNTSSTGFLNCYAGTESPHFAFTMKFSTTTNGQLGIFQGHGPDNPTGILLHFSLESSYSSDRIGGVRFSVPNGYGIPGNGSQFLLYKYKES